MIWHEIKEKGEMPKEIKKIGRILELCNELDGEEVLSLIVWLIASGGHLPEDIAEGMAALGEMSKTEFKKRKI